MNLEIIGEIENKNPKSLSLALRQIADELEAGRWQHHSGGMMINYLCSPAQTEPPFSIDPPTLHIHSDLALTPSLSAKG